MLFLDSHYTRLISSGIGHSKVQITTHKRQLITLIKLIIAILTDEEMIFGYRYLIWVSIALFFVRSPMIGQVGVSFSSTKVFICNMPFWACIILDRHIAICTDEALFYSFVSSYQKVYITQHLFSCDTTALLIYGPIFKGSLHQVYASQYFYLVWTINKCLYWVR